MTDPLFPPLAATFRQAVLRAVISQIDDADVLSPDAQVGSEKFGEMLFNVAFLVLAQLEEGGGFEEAGSLYHSHLCFTPKGEIPIDTNRLISQENRILLHGELNDQEIRETIRNYLADKNRSA
jgi:hypothetical protein